MVHNNFAFGVLLQSPNKPCTRARHWDAKILNFSTLSIECVVVHSYLAEIMIFLALFKLFERFFIQLCQRF